MRGGYAVCIHPPTVWNPRTRNGMFGGTSVPCGSCPRCPLCCVRGRLCLTALALVFAPAFGGGSAHAGYVTSGMVYSGSASLQADGTLRFAFGGERPVEMVAGIPPSVEEERQECLDDSIPLSPWDRRSGTQVVPGSGRSAPAAPVARKGSSSRDVVFYTDPSAPRSPAARLSDYGDTVNLYHPCAKRLFRPPRPAPC
jgi:hypothetical protein